MSTLAQPPIALRSPHLFHVHSSEVPGPGDMEQSEESVNDSHSHHIHQSQHLQTPASSLTNPPTIVSATTPPPAQDSDMEGGEDTAGVSPSSGRRLGFDIPASQSSRRHGLLMDILDTGAPPIRSPHASSAGTPVTQDVTALTITPVDPSPEAGIVPIADDQHRTHLDTAHSDLPGSDHDDNDEDSGEEDDDDEENSGHTRQFYPFEEDRSVPSEEEMKIINGSPEYNAFDHTHWQKKTFFDTKDPEILPRENGVIEWTVEAFNGTKDEPRKDFLIKSHVVRIGDYDWRIKLLPRGHLSTDRVSIYIECVSLQERAQEEWPEEQLPLPTISGARLLRRQAVAAQVSILMYNPEEPRVHEFKSDAHQFQSDSPDHGWSRFTTGPWFDIHRRGYGFRQPLLRNDRVAFKAFIRIVYDPTGCLWAHSDVDKVEDSVLTTGLQQLPPFDELALASVLALLLHLRPFRQLVYLLGAHDLTGSLGRNPLAMLQAVLYRMRTRIQEPPHSSCRLQIHDYVDSIYDVNQESHDVVQTMNTLLHDVEKQLGKLSTRENTVASLARSALEELTSILGSREGQLAGSRKTKLQIANKSTIQEIVDENIEGLNKLGAPQLLIIELDRQIFDGQKRCWKKLVDKVRLDDEINISGNMYTLYGFAAHEGYLQTGKYNSFFRPNGLGNLWYTYKSGLPECLTMAKAVAPREGSAKPRAFEEPSFLHDRPAINSGFGQLPGEEESTAYVVFYVRSDIAYDAFYMSCPESWEVPSWITDSFASKSEPMEDASVSSTDTTRPNEPPANILPTDGIDSSIDTANITGDGDTAMDDVVPGHDVDQEDKAIKVPDETSNNTTRHCTLNYFSQSYYNGQMQGRYHHGEGHLIYLNGDEYVGTFSHGLREGYGKMMYQNGDVYEGSWLQGQYDGKGKYSEKRSGNVYEGNFSEGKKHGEGTTIWKISEEQSRLCQICYSVDANAAFYDCGHVVACANCARRVDVCPVCRRRIRDVLKLYYTA